MWKTVLAGTTALAIAGGTLAYAQQGSSGFERMQRWRPTAEDITAFGEARIAALHAGLKLTAEQEKNWPAVESALRDLAKQRSERLAARASADRPRTRSNGSVCVQRSWGSVLLRSRNSQTRLRRSTRVWMTVKSIASSCLRALANGKAVASAVIMASAVGSIVGCAGSTAATRSRSKSDKSSEQRPTRSPRRAAVQKSRRLLPAAFSFLCSRPAPLDTSGCLC